MNLAALMRGDVDFLECAGTAVIPGLMAGGDGVFIANFYTGNPYRLMEVSDHFGKHAKVSNPPLGELKQVTISKAYWRGSKDVCSSRSCWRRSPRSSSPATRCASARTSTTP